MIVPLIVGVVAGACANLFLNKLVEDKIEPDKNVFMNTAIELGKIICIGMVSNMVSTYCSDTTTKLLKKG